MKLTYILLLFLCVGVNAFAADEWTGRVVGVTDGDTISVWHNGAAEKVRLNGIDAPESNQDFGYLAKQYTSKLCFGTDVNVSVQGKDRDGSTLGIVTLRDGTVLNNILLRGGFAWHYTQYSNDSTLANLEKEARKTKRGLWADKNPVAPWDFRHGITKYSGAVPTPKPANLNQDQVVYRGFVNLRYHKSNCTFVANGKTTLTLTEALSKNLRPCEICFGDPNVHPGVNRGNAINQFHLVDKTRTGKGNSTLNPTANPRSSYATQRGGYSGTASSGNSTYNYKPTARSNDVHVNSYTRKDGTVVRSHYRSSPGTGKSK